MTRPRSPESRWRRLGIAGATVVLVTTAACASASSDAAARGTVDIVASTNVWGRRWVTVHSIIADPDQDPHSYEASARTLLDVKDADLLIENGGGYDDFMGQLIDASGNHAPVLDAVAISGHTAPPGGDLNEHVWFDLPTAARVARSIKTRLSALQPRHAALFAANAARFEAGLRRLVHAEHATRTRFEGTAVGITEPLPLYMLDAMGLRNLTPRAFSDAVEEGGDVATRVLAETLDLYSRHRVALLVYNAQTSSPVTEQIKAAATGAGVPVVAVTETMPVGTTYLAWMRQIVGHITESLSGR
jgi:zinc/manganese transport system substrate-binding protein